MKVRSLRPYSLRGFNLLEVTIAAFIFSLVAISFLGVWGQQVRALEKSRHVMVATFLAEDIIEESMSEGYERLKVNTASYPPVSKEIKLITETRNPSDPDTWDTIDVVYTYTKVVAEAGVTPDDKVRQVVVTVTWVDTTKTGKVVLETFVAGSF